MEATIYQRVKLVLEDKSISVNALSKQINVAQATLNPQLRGDRTLAANIVEKILTAFPDVSAEWLMRGVGTMYSNQVGVLHTELRCGAINEGGTLSGYATDEDGDDVEVSRSIKCGSGVKRILYKNIMNAYLNFVTY